MDSLKKSPPFLCLNPEEYTDFMPQSRRIYRKEGEFYIDFGPLDVVLIECFKEIFLPYGAAIRNTINYGFAWRLPIMPETEAMLKQFGEEHLFDTKIELAPDNKIVSMPVEKKLS